MTRTIAFLGPGAMGAPMVHRLLDAGHDVRVWARRSEAVVEFVERGAGAQESPEAAIAGADIVIGCLRGEAVQPMYGGADGLLSRARKGQLFIEHATVAPELARELADTAAARRAWFIDAPVSGGPSGAEHGALVSMVGGDRAQIDRARSVLSSYCARIVEAGPIGSGATLKLVNQLLVSVHSVAAGEAAAMIHRAGIEPHVAHSALMGGWAGSVMLDILLPQALSDDFDGRGATIGGLVPVLDLVKAQMDRFGIDARVLPAAQETMNVAARTYGEEGLAALIKSPLGVDATGGIR